jgi:hypothetical protein
MYTDIIVCAIVIVYMCVFLRALTDHTQGFDPERAKEISLNKELFNPASNTYEAVKRKMPWMDPVIYYDASQMYKNNSLNQNNIMRNII